MWILVVIAIIGILVILATELTGFIYQLTLSEPKGCWQRLFFESDFDSRNKYLLSAAAQVLGAVFALVFSITLVAGQSVAKYTHRTLTVIFNKWILGYMGAFGGAIIWILSCISYPTDARAVMTVTVGIIFVCLSVPTFFWYLIQRMNLEGISLELKRIGLNATKKNVEVKAREMIAAIDNIGTVALKEGNFEAVKAAEEALGDLLLEVGRFHNDPQGKHPELHQEIYETLRAACLEAIDNPRVPRVIIGKLGEVGADAIKEWLVNQVWDTEKRNKGALGRLPKTEYYAENIIMDVAKACKKDGHARLLYYCASAYREMLEATKGEEKENEKIQTEYVEKLIEVYGRFVEKEDWLKDWNIRCVEDLDALINDKEITADKSKLENLRDKFKKSTQ